MEGEKPRIFKGPYKGLALKNTDTTKSQVLKPSVPDLEIKIPPGMRIIRWIGADQKLHFDIIPEEPPS